LPTITPEQVRRLFLAKQRLAGPRPPGDAAGLLDTVRALGCLQLDPISVVDRSHRLVLWSRTGGFEQGALDRLLWQDRSLFEYWAHCASIVLTEDYPIHNRMMRDYPANGVWAARIRAWMKTNQALRRHILARLRREGPLLSRQLADRGPRRGGDPGGWGNERGVNRMLDFLWIQGAIMVAGRNGGQKLWDLAGRCLPDWTPRQRLGDAQVVRRAAETAVRALGAATPLHIRNHFIRGRYPGLPAALAALVRAGRIARVTVAGGGRGWAGDWYVHADDLALLERFDGDWQPRTTLLSPFDNLICHRPRTRLLFDFDYTIEIYTPPAKRRHGYYVLPILHGDRLIGRIDPAMDRDAGRLRVNRVHAEPGAPRDPDTVAAIGGAIEALAGFLGATDIAYDRRRIPAAWRRLG